MIYAITSELCVYHQDGNHRNQTSVHENCWTHLHACNLQCKTSRPDNSTGESSKRLENILVSYLRECFCAMNASVDINNYIGWIYIFTCWEVLFYALKEFFPSAIQQSSRGTRTHFVRYELCELLPHDRVSFIWFHSASFVWYINVIIFNCKHGPIACKWFILII